MSTSWGNVINIDDEPSDMFGKVMSLRDDLLQTYFLLCTDMSAEEAGKMGARIEAGENPRDLKLDLAEQIVALYWGAMAAVKARKTFIDTFSLKKIPEEVETISVNPNTTLVDTFLGAEIIKSKTEWRRLVDEGAVFDTSSGVKISNYDEVARGDVTYKIGKKRFVKISVQS